MKAQKIATVLLIAVLLGCRGPEGPTGPQGSPGEPGPGTRIIYTGSIGGTGEETVAIPELDFGNMPLIGVYFNLSTVDWVQVNTFLADSVGVPILVEFAVLHPHRVNLYSSTAMVTGFVEYRIVLVI